MGHAVTLGALSTVEVARREGLLVAVPVGSCEQHGPHLPLWTDSMVAIALCDALSDRRHDVVVGPLVGVGASGEHHGFAGTLSVGTPFLASYLTEMVRSSRSWSRGVVFVSGHGGNYEALIAVERTAREEGDAVVTFFPVVAGGDAHAGRTETSLLLHVDHDQVRHNEIVSGCTDPLVVIASRLREEGVAAVSPNGVLGDPTGATSFEGAALLARLHEDLADAVSVRFGPAT
jgi:mycofactocin precursor peptide peptidase